MGSGRTWPHDLRFLTGLPLCDSGAGLDWEGMGDGEAVEWLHWKSSILMRVVETGSMVVSGCCESMSGVRVEVKVGAEVGMAWSAERVERCSEPMAVDCTENC